MDLIRKLTVCFQHGVTKQSGLFSFSRIYDAGHEVPFYQPLTALTVFNRSIHGMDIATGKVHVENDYRTKGPRHSSYRQGNDTVQTSTLRIDSTYNYTLNGPNSPARVVNSSTPSKATRPAHKLAGIHTLLAAKKVKSRKGPRKQNIR
jgi:hypothetical protein